METTAQRKPWPWLPWLHGPWNKIEIKSTMSKSVIDIYNKCHLKVFNKEARTQKKKKKNHIKFSHLHQWTTFHFKWRQPSLIHKAGLWLNITLRFICLFASKALPKPQSRYRYKILDENFCTTELHFLIKPVHFLFFPHQNPTRFPFLSVASRAL